MLIATSVQAADVDALDITHDHGVYDVSARLRVAVSRPAAFKAATSFEALAGHASLIKSSRLVGNRRLSSTLAMCVLFYCKTVHQVVDYRLTSPTAIDMQVVPDAGDLESGEAHWRFVAQGAQQTLLYFNARITPAFWVPPMIGNWAIARALRAQIADTGQAIETLAALQQSSRASQPAASPSLLTDRLHDH